jgi:glycosyltransferase involved in cell wall biosynthesis
MSEPVRALWLINHRTAMRSDASMLLGSGVDGVFLPKSFPATLAFRSASSTREFDPGLAMRSGELELLNATDWYRPLDETIWDLVNRRFSILGFRPSDGDLVRQILGKFRGTIVFRAFGSGGGQSCAGLLCEMTRGRAPAMIESLGDRFVFGHAFAPLVEREPEFLKRRAVHLPLTLPDLGSETESSVRGPGLASVSGDRGTEPTVLFLCPDIRANPASAASHEEFRRHLEDVPHWVIGPQAIRVNDPNVVGVLTDEEWAETVRRARVVLDDGIDPAKLRRGSLEAMGAGTPVVFFAGGLLDRISGERMAGRVHSWLEAGRAVRSLLRGDAGLASRIRASQAEFIKAFNPDRCLEAWRSLGRIIARPDRADTSRVRPRRVRKVAVFLPERYLGGTARATVAIAETLARGARASGVDAKIVLAPLDEPEFYPRDFWESRDPALEVRPARWRLLGPDAVRTAAGIAGMWQGPTECVVPMDGHGDFLDCDAWVIVSDRVTAAVFNAKPVLMYVFDSIRRYVLGDPEPLSCAIARRWADRIAVTTESARLDVIQHGTIPSSNIRVVPPVLPDSCRIPASRHGERRGGYFVWATNMGPHKNHAVAVEAFAHYRRRLDGSLRCLVTGVHADRLGTEGSPFASARQKFGLDTSEGRRILKVSGYVPDARFDRVLSRAHFFWNPSVVDNGTFTAVEAACRGVPTVSSDYPAMRELAGQVGLTPIWSDSWDPDRMGEALKAAERLPATDRPLVDEARLAWLRSDEAAIRHWELVEDLL